MYYFVQDIAILWERTKKSNRHIPSKINGIISTNAPRLTGKWLCLTQHLTSLLDDIFSFPAHANDGSGGKEFAEAREEGLFGEVFVVSLGHFHCGPDHFAVFVCMVIDGECNFKLGECQRACMRVTS